MAKRFFDTNMHKKPWFRALRGPVREAWSIIRAECDVIGIWEIDLDGLNFALNIPPGPDQVTLQELLDVKGFDLQVVEGDKLWISGHVEFQYGDDEGLIAENNKLLPKVLSMLRARGLPPPRIKPSKKRPDSSPNDPPSIPDESPMHGVKEEEEEEKDLGKGGAGGKPPKPWKASAADLESVFQEYPKRANTEKSKGLKALSRHLKNPEQLAGAIEAVKGYARYVAYREKTDGAKWSPEFIKQFKTWCNNAEEWPEWVNWRPPKKTGAAPAQLALTGADRCELDVIEGKLKFQRSRPWSELRSELSRRALEVIELTGGWDALTKLPMDEARDHLIRTMNTPTAARGRDSPAAGDVNSLVTGLANKKAIGN